MFAEQIKTALRTKYQRFGLSNEAVDRIASAKEKTVTNEEDIDSAIADAETMTLIANELQRSADAERRIRSDVQKSFDDYKKAHPEGQKQEPPKQEEEKPWEKQIRELTERLDRRERQERSEATLSSVRSALEKAGCSNKEVLNLTLKGFALGENESEEAAVARIKGEYDASMNNIFGSGPVPPIGGGGVSSEEEFRQRLSSYAKEKGLGKKDGK